MSVPGACRHTAQCSRGGFGGSASASQPAGHLGCVSKEQSSWQHVLGWLLLVGAARVDLCDVIGQMAGEELTDWQWAVTNIGTAAGFPCSFSLHPAAAAFWQCVELLVGQPQ
jgi:hypothetical protein